MSLLDLFRKKAQDDVAAEIEAVQRQKPAQNVTVESIRSAILQETMIPYMKLTLTDREPSIFESKVGGIGYVPHDGQIPIDSKGYQLRLLAQIDCRQITLSDFPQEGLLQFWVGNDDLCGADFENNTKQDAFRILYYREIDRTVTEAEIHEKVFNNLPCDEDFFPVTGCWGLQLSEERESISSSDCRFETCISNLVRKYYPEQEADLLDDPYDFANEENDTGFGHKIGGYPGFTQYDPRNADDVHDVLLFQLDSDFGNGTTKVMWGDSGIANFFINREKLHRCDFSDVIYNWDCC